MSSKIDDASVRPWTFAMAATLFVASALRFVGLQSGLWYDEIVTLVQSARLPFARIATHFGLNVHPLYSVLAHVSMTIFGESAWSLRLPACLFGIATVWMIYVLGARLVTHAEAWAGATIVAVSYHHVWFSQNARGYTMLGFFALLTTDLLLRALESDRPGYYLAYILSAVAGVYTHLTMGFVIAGHVAVAFVGYAIGWGPARALPLRTLFRTWTITALMSVAVYAPFVPNLRALSDERAASVVVATTSWALREAIRALVSGAGVPAALLGGLLAVIGGFSLLMRKPLAVALLGVPGVLTLMGVLALGMPARPRYLFFLVGPAAICLGRGIGLLAGTLQRGTVRAGREPVAAVVALGLVLTLVSAAALPANYRLPKQDFDSAVGFLTVAESRGDRIVSAGPACLPFEEYYGKSWPCWAAPSDWDNSSGGRRVLMAYTLAEYIPNAELQAHVVHDCPVVRHFAGTLGGGDIVVCEARAGAGSVTP